MLVYPRQPEDRSLFTSIVSLIRPQDRRPDLVREVLADAGIPTLEYVVGSRTEASWLQWLLTEGEPAIGRAVLAVGRIIQSHLPSVPMRLYLDSHDRDRLWVAFTWPAGWDSEHAHLVDETILQDWCSDRHRHWAVGYSPEWGPD